MRNHRAFSGLAHRHAFVLAAAMVMSQAGCGLNAGRAAVSLSLSRVKSTPKSASVYIDEEYIGPLYYVAAHGVRLPVGEHRISVTCDGYFPWDKLVQAAREPVALRVQLVPIPD